MTLTCAFLLAHNRQIACSRRTHFETVDFSLHDILMFYMYSRFSESCCEYFHHFVDHYRINRSWCIVVCLYCVCGYACFKSVPVWITCTRDVFMSLFSQAFGLPFQIALFLGCPDQHVYVDFKHSHPTKPWNNVVTVISLFSQVVGYSDTA